MVVPSGEEHVYATLLLNDLYLPGALVLAHSLRDAGTTKKLAVLVTADSVTLNAITQLKTVYDYVLPVPRIRNEQPTNLHLMDRGDLHSTFTKIHLWKHTQFSRIVYIDADVVAYRAPDELFSLPHAFAAAPDIGWPDIFNTGVMVLTPNMGEFYALSAMADKGISFDGADQGLLNMYFKDSFHRLPFTYNVTPSLHYQYLPAYRHYQSSISMVHFIGTNKPWCSARAAMYGSSLYDEMVGRWWVVYDRHYREREPRELIQVMNQTWDAQRQPPPLGSKPEAMNFPATHYTMSRNTAQFVPPKWSASPLTDILYETPKVAVAPITQAPRPIFPWEAHRPRPSRAFVGYEHESKPDNDDHQVTATRDDVQPTLKPFASESPTADKTSELVVHTSPTATVPGDPWSSFPRLNAWDEVPGINRYVEVFDKNWLSKSRPLRGGLAAKSSPIVQDGIQIHGLKLTDFPSEVERPSLPVTPAPIRRPSFWGQDNEPEAGDDGRLRLPAAEGVPAQSEWDPTAQLKRLAQQQSEALLRRLGGEEAAFAETEGHDVTSWPLQVGAEPIKSAAHVAQSFPGVLSPQLVKGSLPTATSSLELVMDESIINPTNDARLIKASNEGANTAASYTGPGAAWDKRALRASQLQTPLPPTEDEKDCLIHNT